MMQNANVGICKIAFKTVNFLKLLRFISVMYQIYQCNLSESGLVNWRELTAKRVFDIADKHNNGKRQETEVWLIGKGTEELSLIFHQMRIFFDF